MTEPWTHNVMAVNGFRMHYVTKRKKGAPISSIRIKGIANSLKL
jgi:hypothetical protein